MGKWGTGKIARKCKVCDSSFYARADRLGLFCSTVCQRNGRVKKQLTYIDIVCKACGKSVKKVKSQIKKGIYCSRNCKPAGKDHWNWNDVKTLRSNDVKNIIKLVKKNKKICDECGSIETLHGHHIKPMKEFPSLALDINNIQVLCFKCHAKKHPKNLNLILNSPQRLGKKLNCKECGEFYYVKRYMLLKSKWCSRKCQIIGLNKRRRKDNE